MSLLVPRFSAELPHTLLALPLLSRSLIPQTALVTPTPWTPAPAQTPEALDMTLGFSKKKQRRANKSHLMFTFWKKSLSAGMKQVYYLSV